MVSEFWFWVSGLGRLVSVLLGFVVSVFVLKKVSVLWFRVNGFGAALICGFCFRFQKCFRACGVSGYGFLLRFCLWFLGLWFMVYDCRFRVSGFGAALLCGFGFHCQKCVRSCVVSAKFFFMLS